MGAPTTAATTSVGAMSSTTACSTPARSITPTAAGTSPAGSSSPHEVFLVGDGANPKELELGNICRSPQEGKHRQEPCTMRTTIMEARGSNKKTCPDSKFSVEPARPAGEQVAYVGGVKESPRTISFVIGAQSLPGCKTVLRDAVLEFDDDGQHVVVNAVDKNSRIWELKSSRFPATLDAPQCRFSLFPDGSGLKLKVKTKDQCAECSGPANSYCCFLCCKDVTPAGENYQLASTFL